MSRAARIRALQRLDDGRHARAERALDHDGIAGTDRRAAPAVRARRSPRHSRRGGSAGSACHSARISGPQQNTRSIALAIDRLERGRDATRGPRGPSSSMSPSTAMRRPCGADRRLAEQRQRGAHRGRIGVVAFVDDQRRPAGQIERRSARRGRRPGSKFGERQRREREIGADEHGGRQHRERIVHEMAARRADLVGRARCRGCPPATVEQRGMQRAFDEPRVGLRMLAERDDARDARLLGAALEVRELRDCRG